MTRSKGRFEYRLGYRREGWYSIRYRIFARASTARHWADRLQATDHAPIIELRIDRRPVGDWQPLTDEANVILDPTRRKSHDHPC